MGDAAGGAAVDIVGRDLPVPRACVGGSVKMGMVVGGMFIWNMEMVVW